MSQLKGEKTLVLIKPDGVKRGLTGEIIARFEKTGLKIAALKMVWVDKDFAAKHYPSSRMEFLKGMGEKTIQTYAKYGKSPKQEMGTDDPVEIGKMVNHWNLEFLTSGPVAAIVLEGLHAVDNVRMVVGNTIPAFAPPGTIRGDYSIDSPALANERKRALHNLVHASGTIDEAAQEITLWFSPEETADPAENGSDRLCHYLTPRASKLCTLRS